MARDGIHTRIISESGFLALAGFIDRLGGYLAIPILTAWLTPEDFGALMAALAAAGFLALLYLSGLQSALFRWYTLWDQPWPRELLESLIFSMILLCALLLLSTLILGFFLLPEWCFFGQRPLLLIAVLAAQILLVPATLRSTVWVADGRAFRLLVLSLGQTLLFLLLLLLLAPLWPVSWVRPLAYGLALLPFALYSLRGHIPAWRALAHLPAGNCRPLLHCALQYGWSVQLTQLAIWAIMYADRVLLQGLAGGAAVAGYVILMLGMLPQFAVLGFNNSFSAQYNRWVAEGRTRVFLDALLSRYLLGGGLLVLAYKLLLIPAAPWIIRLAATEDYLSVAAAMPVCADLIFMYFAYLMFTRDLHARLWIRPIIVVTVLSCLVNLLLNAWLIPRQGIYGALAASWLAYLLLALSSLAVQQWRMGGSLRLLAAFAFPGLLLVLFDLLLYLGPAR